MATPNYSVNYDDKRFTEVEADKKAALNEVDVTYGSMISQSDKYYQQQIDAAQQWADKQSQIQQDNTDFAIEQVEQQKDQAHKDYIKEQSGAYVDWQKQSNQYGANAEQMAAQGMTGSGFSESSQVSMYNTYQNRVATARESYNRAVLNYDNAIKDAQLQNNALLAEIAYTALQTQLELSLEGFQYKNTLIIEQANKKLEVENTYYQRYQDVLNQINTENALAEEVRQYNESLAEEQRQYDQSYAENVRQFNETMEFKEKEYEEQIRQFDEEMELKNKQFDEQIRQFNEEIARLKAKDAQENAREIEKLKLQKEQLEEEKRQYNEKMAEEKRQFNEKMAEEKRQFNATQASKNATITKSSSGSSGSSSSAKNYKKTISGGAAGKVSKDADKISDYVNTRNVKNTSVTVDQQSVLALGFGPISASRLNQLISQGLVQEYQSGNKLKYRLTAKYIKNKQIYNKLGY